MFLVQKIEKMLFCFMCLWAFSVPSLATANDLPTKGVMFYMDGNVDSKKRIQFADILSQVYANIPQSTPMGFSSFSSPVYPLSEMTTPNVRANFEHKTIEAVRKGMSGFSSVGDLSEQLHKIMAVPGKHIVIIATSGSIRQDIDAVETFKKIHAAVPGITFVFVDLNGKNTLIQDIASVSTKEPVLQMEDLPVHIEQMVARSFHVYRNTATDADIHFSTGSAKIGRKDKEKLDHMIPSFLRAQYVLIAGYTDASGKSSSNNILSRKRADAIASFLIQRGVPAYKLRCNANGETEAEHLRSRADRHADAVSVTSYIQERHDSAF